MDVDGTQTRVEELWFSDGSLVVQAGQSLFRVYCAILATRSSVFKDMFTFAQPSGAETIDGCPVVRLSDSAEDVTCFFRAIFDSSFFEPYPSKVSFDSVLSIARLSHKYSVDYLLRRALVHLSYEFPTTPSLFTEGSQLRSTMYDQGTTAAYVAVVQLARQVNALWILPAAFYQLASADKQTIQKVLQCESVFNNHAARLGDDDRILFLTSSVLLSGLEHKAMSFLHSTDKCTSSKKCNTARLSALTRVQNSIEEGPSPNPLNLCRDQEALDILSKGCCAPCYQYLIAARDEARKAIWDKIPGICGLPPWAELEKMKAEALEV
ncbi:hypothetical protein C8R45DRAFT_863706 [Mycena sanguinolenta]|nr:hypothetical protein C8R45DRAFT_863706 [Mycena sanguinolenta]